MRVAFCQVQHLHRFQFIPSRSLSYARCYAFLMVIFFPFLFRVVFLQSGYVEQLGKFTLKKFLLLVLFLDRAKLTRLIDHDPCLFNKEASFKVCSCAVALCTTLLTVGTEKGTEKRFSKALVPSRRGPWERGLVQAGL